MRIDLGPLLAKEIRQLMRSGRFSSPGEVVMVAIQTFQDVDRNPDIKLELLKRAIQEGIDSAERGELIDGEVVMAQLRRSIARAARRRAQRKPKAKTQRTASSRRKA